MRLDKCADCDMLPEPGKKRCSEHLEKRRASKKASRRGSGRFGYVKAKVERKGREWGLTREAYESLISKPCFYCGFVSNVETGTGLDRLNNAEGYFAHNVVSSCKECNLARNDHFSPEEMRVIGAAIRQVKLARGDEQLDASRN